LPEAPCARAPKPPLAVVAALKAGPAKPLKAPLESLRGLPNAPTQHWADVLKTDGACVMGCPKVLCCPNVPAPRLLGCPNEVPRPKQVVAIGLTPKPEVPPPSKEECPNTLFPGAFEAAPNCEDAPNELMPKAGVALVRPSNEPSLPKMLSVVSPPPNGHSGVVPKGVAATGATPKGVAAAGTGHATGVAPKETAAAVGARASCMPFESPTAPPPREAFMREPSLLSSAKEFVDIAHAKVLIEAWEAAATSVRTGFRKVTAPPA